VETLEFANEDFIQGNSASQAAALIWNRHSFARTRERLLQTRPDIVHCHNLFQAASPSIYSACCSLNIPVVQTLHNFRLLCAAGTLNRAGSTCELCIGKLFMWPALRHRCYRNDRLATVALSTMVSIHRITGTWNHRVSQYIALSQFMKNTFVRSGLDERLISVKPNFVLNDTGERPTVGSNAFYAGRLSEEKGILLLLEAWKLDQSLPPLLIAGEGPMGDEVSVACTKDSRIRWIGQVSPAEISRQLASCRFAIVPSNCYEGFPIILAESYAKGVPVVAPKHGSFLELIKDGRTGLFFEPGNPKGLAEAASRLNESAAIASMGKFARLEYESLYTPDLNFEQLHAIYKRTILKSQSDPHVSAPGVRSTGR
jgi:glycosyltransferase involved in cell wall biosynthesis